MSKKKFVTLEEAQTEFDALGIQFKTQETELGKEKNAHEKLKSAFEKLTSDKASLATQLEAEKSEHLKTQDVAKEAIKKLNDIPSDPSKLTAKVDGQTYEIKFGVDGLSKEQLSKDKEKLAVLVAGGSGALVKLEGK